MRQRMQKNEVNETAIQAAADYVSFLSDTQKNEDTCDSNAEIPSEFKSNLDKILADDYKACAEECEKNGETATPNEIEGKLDERKVKFDIQINRPNTFKPQEISFEEIDKSDFTKGFIEFILIEKYVHLYFYFDSILSEDDFISVIDWLESLKEVFGPYTYGGYTNDEPMANDYELRLFPDGEHFLSMNRPLSSSKIIGNKDRLHFHATFSTPRKKFIAREGISIKRYRYFILLQQTNHFSL